MTGHLADQQPMPVEFQAGRTRGDQLKVRVPFAVFAPWEARCLLNHCQSLSVVRDRGGLSASEAAAILEDRPWRMLPDDESLQVIMAHWAEASALLWPPTRLLSLAGRLRDDAPSVAGVLLRQDMEDAAGLLELLAREGERLRPRRAPVEAT